MSNTTRDSGIGLCGALFLLFVALRLTDHIDWAWIWVAAPLWMPLAAICSVLAVAIPVVFVHEKLQWRRIRQHREARERAKRGA